MLHWPVRDAICIECRTVLPAGTPCPAGTHRVEKLHSMTGRDALLTEVWGPKPLRRRIKEAAKAGAIGGTGISVFDGCSGCDMLDFGSADGLHILVGVLIAVAVFGVIWFVVKLVRDVIVRRRRRGLANGARRKGPQLGPSTGRIGTIITRDVARAPIGDRSCVAYSVHATVRRMITLRDAASLGFDVLLETGERVRVPPGPCVIDMTGSLHATDVDTYLQKLDPLRSITDDLDPFPNDSVMTKLLVPGDRVEVLGRLVPTADGSAGGSYRESAHTLLIPDGVPRLRRVDEPPRIAR